MFGVWPAVTTSRAAFEVVDRFEAAVAEYTGAPYCVAVDACTNAMFLALLYERMVHGHGRVTLPRHTYVGVAQAARNAGYTIDWRDHPWVGQYWLRPTQVMDSAKRFTSGMYHGALVCVSFQAGKILPIGRGGAILTDSLEASRWLRRARFDGRGEGEDTTITVPGWHMYLDPPSAARGLWLLTYLPKDNADQVDEYDDLSQLACFR